MVVVAGQTLVTELYVTQLTRLSPAGDTGSRMVIGGAPSDSAGVAAALEDPAVTDDARDACFEFRTSWTLCRMLLPEALVALRRNLGKVKAGTMIICRSQTCAHGQNRPD